MLERAAAANSLGRFQPIQSGDIVVQDPVAFLLAKVGGMARQQGLAIRPCRVGMGKIIRPHQTAQVQVRAVLEGDPVVLEGQIDVFP